MIDQRELVAEGFDSLPRRNLLGTLQFAKPTGFDDVEELPDVLERLCDELDERRARIFVPSLTDVADAYLAALSA